MSDDTGTPLPDHDPRRQLRKMVDMLEQRISRLEAAGQEPTALRDAATLKDEIADLLRDMDARASR